jgi:DNA-binding winged helix-turn-helix (wHTH) protein
MIGQTLGHYRVLEQIGAGGMGLVFRAHDERLDRDVALKVLPPGTLTDENARRRFRQEALTLSKLNHPNIGTVFDFDTQDGMDFLVMELIPGVTLDKKLGASALPEKEVVRLGAQLTEGLAAAHAEGVIHRDLKPGNLRLTPDGRLKILDFGLAKLLHPVGDAAPTESFSHTHGAVGTLPYMAPEQLRGEPADERSDIWAAGAVLYEMATGKRPFPQVSAPMLTDAILRQGPVPTRAVNANLSPELERIISKSLEKESEHRYQSAKELGVDLRRLGIPVSAPANKTFRFAVYEADVRTGELRKQGNRVRLQEQPFQVLVMLLERPGELVTREEIRQRLWGAETFVDFDHSLNTAINKLRETLNDSPTEPRYIETLARRGYRFIAAVETAGSAGAAPAAEAFAEGAGADALPAAPRGAVRLLLTLIQVMYLSFYLVALAKLAAIGTIAEAARLPRGLPELAAATAVLGIPLRLYLLSSAAFDYRGLGGKFRKLFPYLFALDVLWALAPFLLMERIGLGLAFAATAALLYVPFSQRTLVRMGYGPPG